MMSARPSDKAYTSGTHRVRSPAATWREFSRAIPLAGITRLANLTGLDWIGIPVHSAIRPNSRSLSVSQGKGVDDDAARVSALMESLEYWHAEHIDLPLRFESYTRMRRIRPTIDVMRLPRRGGLDGIGLPARETSAAAHVRLDLPRTWIEGVDLRKGDPCWLPFEIATLNKVGLDYAHTTFRISSNGLASGNTMDEAVLHGLCELIERDALTLWWAPDVPEIVETKIDNGSVDDATCRSLLGRFDRAGIDVAIWDATSDLGVPVFQVCVLERATRPRWRPFGSCWGYGAHLDAGVALSRALMEAAQTRVTAIAGASDENVWSQYAAHHDPDRTATIRDALFRPAGRRNFADVTSISTETVAGDVAVTLARLDDRQLDTAVAVDLTKSELSIPVVKIVVPGLEHFSLHVGYSPGPRASARRHDAAR